MQGSPWKTLIAPVAGREYHLVATYLPLKTLRAFPRFASYTLKIRKQLEQGPGVVGYSLSVDFRRFQFYTLSAWESPEHIRRFMIEEPHRAAMKWGAVEEIGHGPLLVGEVDRRRLHGAARLG